MALTDLTGLGLFYPAIPPSLSLVGAGGAFVVSFSNSSALNAVNRKLAFMGSVYLAAGSGSKTISSAGGSISFQTGSAITWATSGTTIQIGIQDISSTAGPGIQPDGTFDVSGTRVQGTDTLAINTWTTTNMGSGTKTITHGDAVAIVIEMTVRNGADSVTASYPVGNDAARYPAGNFFTTSWPTSNADLIPNAIITFNDGTLGWLDCSYPGAASAVQVTLADTTNPDEYGIIFQSPWDCKIDALYCGLLNGAASNSDATLQIYSDPTGSPSVISGGQITLDANNSNSQSSERLGTYLLAAPLSLTRNTSYCVSVKGTGSGSVKTSVITLGSATYRSAYSGGTTRSLASRNNGSGAFSSDTTKFPIMGVRMSAFNDTSGGGGGGGGSLVGGLVVRT